jgi:hypothetical protein
MDNLINEIISNPLQALIVFSLGLAVGVAIYNKLFDNGQDN